MTAISYNIFMARKNIIAGNWKMNLHYKDAIALAQILIDKIINKDNRDIIICPSFPYLDKINHILDKNTIYLGAQDCHDQQDGAHTGDVSAMMLKDIGCDYVIIGHSERRQYYHEDMLLLDRKIKQAHHHGLHIIYCIGETLQQYQTHETLPTLKRQLSILKNYDYRHITIAYEPFWAIGSGLTPKTSEIQTIHSDIRNELERLTNHDNAQNTHILYGGSVKPDNIDSIASLQDVDGALVGGASLKADDFIAICNSF